MYKRNGTLLLHQRRSKICIGAKKKLEELQKLQEKQEEEIKKKEEGCKEMVKKMEDECKTKIEELEKECKAKVEEINDQKIDETMTLYNELEETKDRLDYCKRELEFKEREIEIKQDVMDDLKKTLLRQSEIIAIHSVGGGGAKKKEPTVDITEIPEFKYTSFDDLSAPEKNRIATLLRDSNLTEIYKYVFKKYYITQPANIQIKDYNRGKLRIFKNKIWQDITFDEINQNIFVRVKEMVSIIIKPLIKKIEGKLDNISLGSGERFELTDKLHVIQWRNDIIHCTGRVEPKHSFSSILRHKMTIDTIKTMIKNNQAIK